ncbi:MAG: hypothetical protein Tsb009_34340 [Planctomycetaceae bacterium]
MRRPTTGHLDEHPCPMCGEEIDSYATRCPYCGEWLDESWETDRRRRRPRQSKLVKQFNQQTRALGGFWIFIAVISVGAGLFLFQAAGANLNPGNAELVALLIIGLGFIYLSIGILAIAKVIPAIYVGLVLTYLSLISSFAQIMMGVAMGRAGGFICGNIFGILICLAVIVQAHRVIKWSKELNIRNY